MSDVAAIIADAASEFGTTAILRRRITGGEPVDITVRAVVRGYAPVELIGEIVQGDQEACIGNAEIARWQWPGPPRRGDLFIVAGRTSILQGNADTTRIDDVIVRHTMHLRGE